MSYINPEYALKRAQELKDEGSIQEALEELHQALHGKKFKGNNIILERIMVSLPTHPLFPLSYRLTLSLPYQSGRE